MCGKARDHPTKAHANCTTQYKYVANRLTLAVCTTHVPTPEEPACTRTRLPDLVFQSDIACMQASDHLLRLHQQLTCNCALAPTAEAIFS